MADINDAVHRLLELVQQTSAAEELGDEPELAVLASEWREAFIVVDSMLCVGAAPPDRWYARGAGRNKHCKHCGRSIVRAKPEHLAQGAWLDSGSMISCNPEGRLRLHEPKEAD